MSTDTGRHEWTGNANVLARLKGGAFKYACLAAALFGIVTLAFLLAYVSIDAFELQAADSAWFGVYSLTVVLPTAAFWWRLRGTAALDVAKTTIGGLLLSVGVGAFLVVLSIIVTPTVWTAYFLLTVLPAGALVAYGDRIDAISDARSVALAVAVSGVLVASIARTPLTDAFGLAKPWLLYLVTVAVPLGAAFHLWAASRGERLGEVAGAVVVGTGLLAGALEELGFVGSAGAIIVFVSGFSLPLVAVLLAQRRTIRDAPSARIGFALPAVIIGGALVGTGAVTLLGVATPDPWVRPAFFQNGPSRLPERAGLYPPIIGSVFMLIVMIAAVFPLGVGAAVYLEEYASDNRLTQLIQVNLANLAGVPSVVYGLLGLAVFARGFDFTIAGRTIDVGLGLGTVITAGLTVGLLVLPIVIISAQEAIRSVPESVRRASYGMGASRWQTTREVVLPEAFPGILTGTILALGRAIGETAPLIMVGAATSVSSTPDSLFSTVTAMPLQVYAWRGSVQPEFRYGVVAAGVVTLLIVLLGMNAAAIVLRDRYERR